MVGAHRFGSARLRLAVLGGGVNSAVGMAHKHALELSQSFDVVAGCFSRHADVNAQTAEIYGLPPEKLYNDLSSMLAAEKSGLDALLILTPTRQHTPQVLEAFAAGIPVICEKALAGSVSEVEEIESAASSNFLAVTFNYTGYPIVREIKDMVESGKLGKLQQMHLEMPQEGFLRLNAERQPMRPQDWRLEDGIIPTISLDLGVHTHSLLKFLSGQAPVEVSAAGQSFGNFPDIADNMNAMINCDDGLFCTMWYGKTALGVRNGLGFRLFGTEGSVEWLQEIPEVIKYADRSGQKMQLDRGSPGIKVANAKRYERFKVGHPAGFIEAFANYYQDVADALIARKEGTSGNDTGYVLGLPEAREGIMLLDAMERSRAEKRWVSV